MHFSIIFKTTMIFKNQKVTKLAINSVREYSKLDASIGESIKSIFGSNNFTLSESIRQHHAHDESLHQFSFFRPFVDFPFVVV